MTRSKFQLFQKWQKGLTWIVLAVVVLGLRYPFYAILADVVNRLGYQPWEKDFAHWCVWDCGCYASLSGSYTIDNVVYFPGFPLTVMGFRTLFPFLTANAATILVSNLFSIVAFVLMIAFLAMLNFGPKWRDAYPWNWKIWITTALLAFFPYTLFWSSGYGEAEQMTAFLLVYILAYQKKWIPASWIAGVAALIRIQSCWFAAALGGMILFDQIWKKKKLLRLSQKDALICLTGLCLPFSIFMGWQWMKSGDALSFIHRMSNNGRGLNLVDIVRFHFPKWDMNYFILILSHVAAFQMIRKPEAHWKLIALVTWLLALMPLAFGGFIWGYGRYTTCNLGLFILLGTFFSTRPWFALPALGWCLFRSVPEIEGWTRHLWRG